MKLKPVFYVEDDENDAFLMKRAFKQCGISNPLVTAADGQEAIDHLRAFDQKGSADIDNLPCLVLLDLNLPGKTGHDVLRWIRKTPSLRSLVVVMLTSSLDERDLRKAYSLGANAYLVKPTVLDSLLETVRTVRDFWLLQNHVPLAPGAHRGELAR